MKKKIIDYIDKEIKDMKEDTLTSMREDLTNDGIIREFKKLKEFINKLE